MIEFLSQYSLGPRFMEETPDEQTIKNEPMFFQMPLADAYDAGGPITRCFLHRLGMPRAGRHDNAWLDSRVHMLMPGWWPCIPGWHHDDVERSREDGQPNYRNASYRPHFALGLVGTAYCPTEFATGLFQLPDVENGIIYKDWHPRIDADVDKLVSAAPYNQIVYFDDRTLHQGTQCTQGGWRWFGRVTFGNPNKPAAEMRRQVNVYMEHPMEGW